MKKDNTYIVHLTAEDLQQFISGQLLQLDRREAIEEHLQQCELCLLLFMQELEAHEHQTAGTDWTALENNVIAPIEAEAAAVVIGESGEPAPLVQHVEQLKQQAALAQHAEQSKQHAASAQQAVQSKQPASTRRRRTWLGRPVVQYSIAASITLLLISTGALSGLSQQVEVGS